MNGINYIDQYLNIIIRKKSIYHMVEFLLMCLVIISGLFICVSTVDYFIPLSPVMKYAYWLFVVLLAVVMGVLAVRQILLVKRKEHIISELQAKFSWLSDDLINAWQLKRNINSLEELGISRELADVHIEHVRDKISKDISINEVVDFRKLNKYVPLIGAVAILFFALYVCPPNIMRKQTLRMFYPMSSLQLAQYMTISPGDAKLLRGTDVNITVKLLIDDQNRPTLYTKTGNLRWDRIRLTQVPHLKNKFVSEPIHLVSKIDYYIEWRYLRSRKYTIEPLQIPKLGNFKVVYHFPKYTELDPRESNTFSELPCLVGTRIYFTAAANKPLKSAALFTTWGTKIPVRLLADEEIEGELIIEQSGECYFELEDIDGNIDPEPTRYQIDVLKDLAPEVEILSPAEDLVVAGDSKVSLVYKVSDDYGISNVKFITRLRSSASRGTSGEAIRRSRTIEQFAYLTKDEILEYSFDVSLLLPEPGDVIEYFLEVYDNDLITGPKKSYSDTYRLEIFSYEQEHEDIENELKAFRDDLINLLGKQSSAKEYLDKFILEKKTPLDEDKAELLKLQNEIKRDTDLASSELKEILSRMELDPYTNFQVYTEYKYIRNGLNELKDNQMTNAVDSLKNNQWNKANVFQDEIVTALERMNLISEDVLKYQKMQDLLKNNEKIADIAEDMISSLSSQPDEAQLAQLKEALDEVDALMKEIQKIIEKLPQELPEEFINQEAVKNLDFGKMSSLSQSLRENIARGNLAEALAQARSLLEQAKSMLGAMQGAGDSVSFSSTENELMRQVGEVATELESIISEQSGIIRDTSKLEGVRQGLIMKKQEDKLAELARLQHELIKKSNSLKGESNKIKSPSDFSRRYVASFNRIIPEMEKVYGEMQARKVVKSQDILSKIITQLEDIEKMLSEYRIKVSTEYIKGYTNIEDGTLEVKLGEKKILDILKSASDVSFNKKDRRAIQNLSEKQSFLTERTRKLDRSLQELSRKTAVLTPEISYNLRQAAHEMKNAKKNLDGFKTDYALDDENQALDYLTKGNSAMQNAMQAIGQVQARSGQPMSGYLQGTSGGGGVMGIRTGYVKLPRKDEYIPSRELREELMKSLKEKYPKVHEDVIRRYYKELIK